MTTPRILVSGATGSTGRAAVSALQHSGAEVHALVRTDDARAAELRDLGARTVVGDLLDLDSVRAALDGIDVAYFVYPVQPRLLEATAFFAQAALEASVGAILNMSQITARRDAKSHAAQGHWAGEGILERTGIPVTHLRPTLFAEWLLYSFSLDTIIHRDTVTLPFGGGRISPIAAHDQGRVIAAILADPEAHAGQTYILHGPAELDGEGIAAALTWELQRPISYQAVPIEQFQATLAGIPRLGEYFAQHVGAIARDVQDGRLSGTNTTVEDITGTRPMSLQQFVHTNGDRFAPATTTDEE